ncbi:glycosyltransferase [uncultured Williamsia sp.]|uniref:glycosyltransferase n=1 Tax=uncultured Williamsia sp. TaxID=259311 RepID=UPI00261149FF|nr:glycosyltransferase [uncultured Williamsia sp.]
MRILHVATLFTPTGEFGGPTRVAVHQAAGLARRGHCVTVTGAGRGWHTDTELPPDIECRFFPAQRSVPGIGIAGLRSPSVTRFVASHVRDFDVAHIHLARDLVTIPAARAIRRSGVPYVVQCHGMVDPTSKVLAGPLDRYATVPVLTGAARVLTLTDTEETGLTAVAGRALPFRRVVNGVPSTAANRVPSDPPEVLFLARLDERKRPLHFVRAAATLLSRGVRARFTLIGPDGGQAADVDAAIAASGRADAIHREPAIESDDVADRMRRASIYVLPSVDEPFPMTVLEAMSVGVPVVVTASCGLAPVIDDCGCGVVTDHSDDALRDAVAALLADPGDATRRGVRGRERVRKDYSVGAVAATLEAIYDECTSRPREDAG